MPVAVDWFGQFSHFTGERIEKADLCAAFARGGRTGQQSAVSDGLAVGRPVSHVGTVARAKPVTPTVGQDTMFRTVGASDAQIR